MNILQNNDAVYVEDGVEYHAVTQPRCFGEHGRCAFYDPPFSYCTPRPCTPGMRNDKTDVIWVKAE